MMKASADLPIALSLGDPAGIGPELIVRAWARHEELGLQPFFVCGGASTLASAANGLGLDVPVISLAAPGDARAAYFRGLPVFGSADCDWRPGKPDREGAVLALESLQSATMLARKGMASAVVTGPIAKARLAEIGFQHPGQTEFVAAECGIPPEMAVMMLAGPSLRTVPLTIHVALTQVPRLIDHALIISKCQLIAQALVRDFGIASPRIAVAALNPHAGEEGRMGDEDQRIVAPAIAVLRAMGIDATGPHPADALFAPHARSGYDVAVCMYHDQALIPIKALDFDQGVNITLGLPIIRTSPDHGTAFAIAGKGQANPGAMIAAINMAGEMAQRRASIA